MKETNNRSTPEFPIDSIVPILQHRCARGKLGISGKTTKLNSSGQPMLAKCLECQKIIEVDLSTLNQQKNRRK